MAHVSHWDKSLISYDIHYPIETRVTESWAVGVEAVITTDVYGFTNIFETKQDKRVIDMTGGGYTSLVWDLIDTYNQYTTNTAYPNDQVENYTLSQIEQALPSILGSWWVWRDNLKDNFDNPTEEYVNSLFDQLQ